MKSLVCTHSRDLNRPVAEVFALLEAMGTDQDRIWPDEKVRFTRTPGPLVVGETHEQHGLIRATLAEYVPSERIVWGVDIPMLKGTHGFYVEKLGGGRTRITHRIAAKVAWGMLPMWKTFVQPLHDRIIEGIFDRIEA